MIFSTSMRISQDRSNSTESEVICGLPEINGRAAAGVHLEEFGAVDIFVTLADLRLLRLVRLRAAATI
ncbi:hypothetical protein [Rhodococcus wratislaviensis]|uniref:hypothetical protein n=1 Tax=Rhodococcus wratislaviensis TaxID=44752 RepID=UPI0012DC410E|nr:hypothetical protein [Rhodococcus wratislaviensis]